MQCKMRSSKQVPEGETLKAATSSSHTFPGIKLIEFQCRLGQALLAWDLRELLEAKLEAVGEEKARLLVVSSVQDVCNIDWLALINEPLLVRGCNGQLVLQHTANRSEHSSPPHSAISQHCITITEGMHTALWSGL